MKLPRLPRALRLDLPLLLLLLALFPALAPCADGAQTSPTPTAPPSARLAFQTGRNDYNLPIGGQLRNFIVHVPARYNPAVAAPVVVMFHGTSGDGEVMYTGSGWVEKANAEGIIAVFPSSLRYEIIDEGLKVRTTKWNFVGLRAILADPTVVPVDDDVFIREMLALVHSTWNVDRRRVFASGFSNGAQYVSTRLLSNMSDIFSAFGCTGGGHSFVGTTPANPNVSYFLMFGNLDDRILTATGRTEDLPMTPTGIMADPYFGPFITVSILPRLALASTYDVASGENARMTTLVFDDRLVSSHSNEFRFRMIENLGHAYPAIAPDDFWTFFQRHTGRATPFSGPPVVTFGPTSQSFALGQTATLVTTVTSATPATYQWKFNGVVIPGATGPTYSMPNVTAAQAGTYTMTATNASGSVTSPAATVTVLTSAWLSNLSVRTRSPGSQPVIVGFVVDGGTESVLLRAAGPSLAEYGVTSAMVDPRLELYQGAVKIAENNDWSNTLALTFRNVGAFSFPPGSKDAALEQVVSGAATVHASGTSAGVLVVEGYDSGSNASARLVNLSARNLVGTGENLLIAGFNVAGAGTQRVLIRAIGPALGAFGVAAPLADPRLEIFSSGGVKIGEADNWDAALATTFASAGAFALPANSRDAATVLTLPAGASYTVQVSGVNGTTGEALIEVYALP